MLTSHVRTCDSCSPPTEEVVSTWSVSRAVISVSQTSNTQASGSVSPWALVSSQIPIRQVMQAGTAPSSYKSVPTWELRLSRHSLIIRAVRLRRVSRYPSLAGVTRRSVGVRLGCRIMKNSSWFHHRPFIVESYTFHQVKGGEDLWWRYSLRCSPWLLFLEWCIRPCTLTVN